MRTVFLHHEFPYIMSSSHLFGIIFDLEALYILKKLYGKFYKSSIKFDCRVGKCCGVQAPARLAANSRPRQCPHHIRYFNPKECKGLNLAKLWDRCRDFKSTATIVLCDRAWLLYATPKFFSFPVGLSAGPAS